MNAFKFCVPLLIAALMGSCGGGSQDETNQQAPNQKSPSIVGQDADQNGVWDYIDPYLSTEYGAVPEQFRAASGLAVSVQNVLIAGSTNNSVTEQRDQYTKALFCFVQVIGDDSDDKIEDIVALLTNTQERVVAYMDYHAKLSEFVMSFDPGVDYCA